VKDAKGGVSVLYRHYLEERNLERGKKTKRREREERENGDRKLSKKETTVSCLAIQTRKEKGGGLKVQGEINVGKCG